MAVSPPSSSAPVRWQLPCLPGHHVSLCITFPPSDSEFCYFKHIAFLFLSIAFLFKRQNLIPAWPRWCALFMRVSGVEVSEHGRLIPLEIRNYLSPLDSRCSRDPATFLWLIKSSITLNTIVNLIYSPFTFLLLAISANDLLWTSDLTHCFTHRYKWKPSASASLAYNPPVPSIHPVLILFFSSILFYY